jgi:hypothetical protein
MTSDRIAAAVSAHRRTIAVFGTPIEADHGCRSSSIAQHPRSLTTDKSAVGAAAGDTTSLLVSPRGTLMGWLRIGLTSPRSDVNVAAFFVA